MNQLHLIWIMEIFLNYNLIEACSIAGSELKRFVFMFRSIQEFEVCVVLCRYTLQMQVHTCIEARPHKLSCCRNKDHPEFLVEFL